MNMKRSSPAQPWERQPKETDKSFEAFATYRDMGTDRSYVKVAQRLSKSQTIIKRWGVTHNWVNRIEAWNDEQDRIIREELIKGIATMQKNHVNIANQMLIKAMKALQRIPAEEMTMQDIARAVDVGTKLERLSRGEPTSITEGAVQINYFGEDAIED